MTDRDDLDMLAAEFVLGTLDARERATVVMRRQSEPDLDEMIVAWERRLAALADEVTPVTPDPDLYQRIKQQIDAIEARQTGASNDNEGNSNVISLRKRLRRWQWSTALASAAAIVLVTVLTFQPAPEQGPQSFVAVFQQNDQQPAFMLSVDLTNRQMQIRPVTAEPMQGKSYQMWIKADSLGPNPRSLGVLDDNLKLDRAALRDYDPELLKEATFGISVEPEGGSPTGQPSGPAIHGYLYPVADGASGRSH
jgi:anti-sigma-K factor RskA